QEDAAEALIDGEAAGAGLGAGDAAAGRAVAVERAAGDLAPGGGGEEALSGGEAAGAEGSGLAGLSGDPLRVVARAVEGVGGGVGDDVAHALVHAPIAEEAELGA